VRAALDRPAGVKHHDLVDLVEPVGFVGDVQDGAAFRGVQQVRSERAAAVGV
jgi:hypothetical protein